jgi:WD40 repeat protein
LWNADNGEKLCTFGDTNAEIWSAAFRPMMNEIAVGGRIPQVTFWNTENCQFIRSIEGHQRTVSSVIYDPPGKLFASAGWDGVINVYDAITAKPFSSMKGLPWTSVAIAFSPNSQRLVSAAGRRFAAYAATPGSAAEDRPKSAGRPQELRIWEVGTGIDLLSLTGRTPPVCASFSPDGRSLASGGEDGSVTLWLTEAKTP